MFTTSVWPYTGWWVNVNVFKVWFHVIITSPIKLITQMKDRFPAQGHIASKLEDNIIGRCPHKDMLWILQKTT
jgi:hypothetical protein